MTNFDDQANEAPNDPTSVADFFREKLKKPSAPEGFSDAGAFIKWAIKLYSDDVDNDRDNREQAVEDMKFVAGDQWEERILTRRIADRKPTLTLNRLPAFIGQLVGNRKLNETEIKVAPDNDTNKDVARIREGLIRNIQRNTMAQFAYDKAYENQVISGMGNFKIELDFASDDVFEQDIKIKALANPLGVVWDRMSIEPTGSDANHCFVIDTMTRDEFKKEYPDAQGSGLTDVRAYLTGQGIEQDWFENDVFRVLEFWRMKTRKRFVALLRSDTGEDQPDQVEDVTDMEVEDFIDRLVTNEDGDPIMREVDRRYAEMYIISATDILEGPYELPIDRLPIIKVTGWNVNVGERNVRFGLIRYLKDPQRLLNYWRSVIAEKLMLTPKGNWVASDKAVEGREKEWRNSHNSNNPLLIYNSEAGSPPTRVPPAQLEGALIQEAGMAAQDLNDISNLTPTNLGQQGNEVSGRAINARQRIGEVGTVIYEANLQIAMEEAGRVINDLIPIAYDTQRTIKVLGEDGKELPPVLINDTTNEDSVDITTGKYSVTTETGPSYVSKRAEAADAMLNMVNAAPQALTVALDKIIENQDWPGASEIAARLRTQLPPGVVSEEDMTPQEVQAMRAAQQAQQAQQDREDAVLQADLDERMSRADHNNALSQQAIANAAKTFSEVGVKAAELAEKEEDNRQKRFLEAVARIQDTMTTNTTGVDNG